MFLGEYEYNIDQKGRLAIPARFRDHFREGLVLLRGLEKCVEVYPVSKWNQVAQRLASLPAHRSANRRLTRNAFANAFQLELDKQGRVILPPALRLYAGIADLAVVVGLYDHLEVWGLDEWRQEKALMDDQATRLAEELDTSAVGSGSLF